MTTAGFTTDSNKVRVKQPATPSNPLDTIWSKSRLSMALDELARRAPGSFAFDTINSYAQPDFDLRNAVKDTSSGNGFSLVVDDPLLGFFTGGGEPGSFEFNEEAKGFYFKFPVLVDTVDFTLVSALVNSDFESISAAIGMNATFDPGSSPQVQIMFGDFTGGTGFDTTNAFTPSQLSEKEFFFTAKILPSDDPVSPNQVTINLYTDENESPLLSHVFDATPSIENYRAINRVGLSANVGSSIEAEYPVAYYPDVPDYVYQVAPQAISSISIDENNLPEDGNYLADIQAAASSSIGTINRGSIVSIYDGVLAGRTLKESFDSFVRNDESVDFKETVQFSGQVKDKFYIETNTNTPYTEDFSDISAFFKNYIVDIQHDSGSVVFDVGDAGSLPNNQGELEYIQFDCAGKSGIVTLQSSNPFVINGEQVGNTFEMQAGASLLLISSPTQSFGQRYIIIELASGTPLQDDSWSLVTTSATLEENKNYQFYAAPSISINPVLPPASSSTKVIQFTANVFGTGAAGSGLLSIAASVGDEVVEAGTITSISQPSKTAIYLRDGDAGIIFRDRGKTNRWVVAFTRRSKEEVIIDDSVSSPIFISNNDYNGKLVVVDRTIPLTIYFQNRPNFQIMRGFNFELIQISSGKTTLGAQGGSGVAVVNVDGLYTTRGVGAKVKVNTVGDAYFIEGALE
jgi:hypothetical protein